MPATHKRDFLHKFRVLLFLLGFDFHNDLQIEKDTSEPSAAPGPQPTPLYHSHSHQPGEEESHQTPGSCPGYFKEKKEGIKEPPRLT